uniref:L1 transposable element RRM domain-containing protein n=1 Tax=Fundulus heteroclitus TaxID=8078 RepID=A0A3Q2QPH0_FUNHE
MDAQPRGLCSNRTDRLPSPNHGERWNNTPLKTHRAMEAIEANILAKLKEVQADLKKEITNKTGLVNKEMSAFREDMGKRLDDIEFNADVKDVLGHTLLLQEDLQARLSDLEARSRRNNIRIHGIPEGEEGDSMQVFIENFIKTALSLTDTTLGIQRCHRSLGPKPPPSSNPRSIVVNFLDFKTKDLVLRSVWNKKEIQLKGRRVYFDQDYPTDILLKRKVTDVT